MPDLIATVCPNEARAEEAGQRRFKPQAESVITLRAAVIAIRTKFFLAAIVALTTFALAPAARVHAQTAPQGGAATLFQNVRILDGKGSSLSAPANVLVKGKTIERISVAAIDVEPGTTVIAGSGRTLMPGLIDAHWHAMLIRSTPAEATTGDVGYNNLLAGDEATDTLMRGFTTVRDVGGPTFGLKKAIDEGVVRGPRIYPAGAVITVTSGHGDFRQLS